MKLTLEPKLREILMRYHDSTCVRYPDEYVDDDMERIAAWLIEQVFAGDRVSPEDDE
jgi:hypothetical protein